MFLCITSVIIQITDIFFSALSEREHLANSTSHSIRFSHVSHSVCYSKKNISCKQAITTNSRGYMTSRVLNVANGTHSVTHFIKTMTHQCSFEWRKYITRLSVVLIRQSKCTEKWIPVRYKVKNQVFFRCWNWSEGTFVVKETVQSINLASFFIAFWSLPF